MRLLLLLKIVNGMATVLFGLLVSYVFVRVLGVEGFAEYVLLAAVANYLLLADLGLSKLVYVALRADFLDGRPGGPRAAALAALAALAVHGAAALAACLGCLVYLWAMPAPPGGRLGFFCYFAFVVLYLPWIMLRQVAGAIDRFLMFEAADLARRLATVAILTLPLLGLSFEVAALLLLATWGPALVLVLGDLRRRLFPHGQPSLGAGFAALRDHRRGAAGGMALLTAAEFGLYNLPYLLVPLAFGAGAAVVVFDTFYKVVRLAVAATRIGNESLLPRQTRAMHGGDRPGLGLATGQVLALGLLAVLPLALLILFAGESLFGFLLGDPALLPASVRHAMVGMLFAMLLFSGASQPLVHGGAHDGVARTACALLAAMVVAAVAALGLGADIARLIAIYVAVFALGGLLYGRLFLRYLAGMRLNAALAAP